LFFVFCLFIDSLFFFLSFPPIFSFLLCVCIFIFLAFFVWDQHSEVDRGIGCSIHRRYKRFVSCPKLALGPTQSPIQSVPGSFSPGIKRPVREADHLSLSSVEAQRKWRCAAPFRHEPPWQARGQLFYLLIPLLSLHICY
jgi:hypothetical protein